MAYFGVGVQDLPGYSPWLKGRVEALNGAADKMLFSRMPRYTDGPKQVNGKPFDPGAPPLRFEAFVAEVMDFIRDWNARWPKQSLDKRTPAQVWEEDASPIVDVPDRHLVLFTMEDQGTRVIGTRGVQFKNLHYVGPCLNGRAGSVRVRWMPNHPELIELFDADTLEYLGRAEPSDDASPDLQQDVIAKHKHDAKQLREDLNAAKRRSRVKWAAATTAAPPQTLGLVSETQARTELDRSRATKPPPAGPRPFPRRPPAPGWAIPGASSAERPADDEQA